MVETPQLKPCPFCGGEAGTHHYERSWRRPEAWTVECCGECEISTPRYDTAIEAVAAWDRRAAPAGGAGELGRLKAELRRSEWSASESGMCPRCGQFKPDRPDMIGWPGDFSGHEPGCSLAAALAPASPPADPPEADPC